jgi:uncharacterized protein YbcI
MTDTSQATLQADITSRLVHLMKEHLGRGPRQAWTVVSRDLVACLMESALTTAERTLVNAGREDTVHEVREGIQEGLETAMRAAVESATGRRVIAFMSANHVDPDYTAEIFVLEPAPAGDTGDPS